MKGNNLRNEFIITKVKPIKKLFIIDADAISEFEYAYNGIQDEIDGIQNIILINDDELFSEINHEFVKRSDPDLIINRSQRRDDEISKHFGILSSDAKSEETKVERYSTKLQYFSRTPAFFEKFAIDSSKDLYVLAASSPIANSDEAYFQNINFGYLNSDSLEKLRLSIYKNMKLHWLADSNEAIGNLFSDADKLSLFTSAYGSLSGTGYGTSIYEVNYNREDIFADGKKYVFVSDRTDLKSIAYFWNTRSYYCHSKLAWIPTPFLGNVSGITDEDTIFVCFNDAISDLISTTYPKNKILRPEGLRFKGKKDYWTFFENTQIVATIDDELIIQHPPEKSFIDFGGMGAFTLEISGLKEFIYPKRRNAGKLFRSKRLNHELFDNHFCRLSENGLSKYSLVVSPFEPVSISATIRLPLHSEIIKHLIEDYGYVVKKTPKTLLLDQAINLLGGIDSARILSKRMIFEMIINLTPKVRTEKAIKKLLEGVPLSVTSDDILSILSEIKSNGAINFPSVTLTYDEIVAKGGASREDGKSISPEIQKLYDQRVLLRGKFIECSFCKSNVWIELAEIRRRNNCTDCGNPLSIPVYVNDKQDSDYYRLNQLFVRAVDQGQLATILLINLFQEQKFRSFRYQSNLEIYENDHLVTDLDLVLNVGKQFGIAECKSFSGFTTKQVKDLIDIAIKIKCDFIVFSTLLNKDSQEVIDLKCYLDTLSLNIPAIIACSEAIFNPTNAKIYPIFEIGRGSLNRGPIIL